MAEAVVAVALLCPAAIAAEASWTEMIPVALDAGQYAEFMAGEIQDERDLADVTEIQRRWFNRITPPGFSWVQPMFPSVAPFDAEGFSESFLDGLLGEARNSVAVYPLSLALDPKTRETLIHDADGKLIAILPSDGVSRAWPEDADPARVVLQLDLLPSEDVEPYLYVEGRIAESAKARVAKPKGSSEMVLRSLGANEFGFAGAHRLTNGQLRLTATNGTDVAEIYSYTVWHTSTVVVTVWTNEYDEVVTSTNLVWDPVSPPYAGIESAWECQTTNLVLAGGVGTWDDPDVSTNARVRFYAAAKRMDSDEDGLTDGTEIFLYRTDPGLPDSDGDGIPDGAEIELGLDPLDPTDAAEDPDGDGSSNLLEYQLGSPMDNPAWNGEQLVYRLMHANTNHSLRVEVADSENCGGTGLTQYVTASLSVPDLLDCGYFLDITVTGNVEDHMSQYDHVYVRALDEKFYFGGDQNYVACSYVAKTGTLNHLVLPNSQITLIYDTVSYKHHVDGYAAITDAAVTDILSAGMDWEALDSALDDNPNWNGGKRIFPDKQSPTDSMARDKVRLRAKLTPALPNIPLHFKAFDVDDPTPSSMDPSGVIDSNGQSGNDNRGLPSAGTLSATSGTTDDNGEVVVEFTVSKQPGDNFRVAVALDQAELNKLTVTTPNSSSHVTPDNTAPGNFCGGISPMLTVWRRLWLEFDSLEAWPSTGDEKNFEAGTITGIQSNTPSAGQSSVQLDMLLLDEEDRYEDGYILITGVGQFTIEHNSDNLLFDDTVVILGVPAQNVVGQSFTIYDDDNVQIGSRPPRTMPYSLSGGTLINTAFADAYIRPEPVPSTYIDNNVPFKRNMDAGFGYYFDWLPTVNHSRDLDESADFWYSYLLACFQPEVSADNDPDSPDATKFGQSDPGIVPKNRGTIYVETLREFEMLPATPRINEEHTIVHEIGHQGGGSHGDGDIMTDGAPIDQDKFAPVTIEKFRDNTTF